MRRAAWALLALLACRARARREEEPFDAGAQTDRVSVDDVRVEDAGRVAESESNPLGLRGFRVTAANGWRVRVRSLGVPGVLREGAQVRAHGGEVIEVVAPMGEDVPREVAVVEEGGEGARFGVRGDGAAIELPWWSGVAGVIQRGDVRVRLPRLAGAPLRFDTAQGRVIVAEGEASIRVGVARGAAWTEVSARGAAVTVWAPRGDGALAPEVLPARGTRRWRALSSDPCEGATRAIEEAAGVVRAADAGVEDLALARASMALGRASAWIGHAGAAGPLARCARALRGRRDELSARLAALAR